MLKYYIDKYNLLFVYPVEFESHGNITTMVLKFALIGIFFFQFIYNILDIFNCDRIDTCKRLIQKDELRVYGKGSGNLTAPSLSAGKLDSLAFADFLVELEEQFEIVISPSEVEREDINTPEKILEMVEARR